MVTTIAKWQGAELSPATAAKLVASAVAGVSAYTIGSKILTWAGLLVGSAAPFATWPAAMAFNAALNAVFTYKLGRALHPQAGPRAALRGPGVQRG